MKKIALILACSMALACGDDDTRADGMDDPMDDPSADGGVDLGGPVDLGPGVDMYTPSTLGSMCPMPAACNVVTSDGCDVAGEACYFVATEAGAEPAATCVEAGSLGLGAPCTAGNACQEGLICVGDPGVCRRLCCPGSGETRNDDDCMPTTTGELCSINLVDEAGEPTGIGACRLPDDCDPIAQTGCDDGACYPSGDGAFACAPPGTGGQGDNCDDVDCAAGFLCITGDPNPICAQICDTTSPTCDAAGTTCGGLNG